MEWPGRQRTWLADNDRVQASALSSLRLQCQPEPDPPSESARCARCANQKENPGHFKFNLKAAGPTRGARAGRPGPDPGASSSRLYLTGAGSPGCRARATSGRCYCSKWPSPLADNGRRLPPSRTVPAVRCAASLPVTPESESGVGAAARAIASDHAHRSESRRAGRLRSARASHAYRDHLETRMITSSAAGG